MEKSQNGSDKGSKNLTDNRKRFNVLYIMGEEGGERCLDIWAGVTPSLGQVQISEAPREVTFSQNLYKLIDFGVFLIKTQDLPPKSF